jgi:plasmid stabilization system protein ParE
MVRRIIWSKNALRDKVQILDYWHKRIGTKTYSRKLDKELRHSIKNLEKFPKLGRRLENTEIHFIVRENYQIFYKYKDEEIRILHIWDSRRDPEDLIIER